MPSKATFAFARLKDGSTYAAQSSWQGLALAFGGLDPAKTAAAAARLNRPELTTDWGARLFATDSPYYDPLSYNDGSVWPFVTGFAILGEYANHQPVGGLHHLYGVAVTTGLSAAGFIPEYMSGERAQSLPHTVPHQLFSSSAVINPLVSGMLGLDGNALDATLTASPHIPQGWTVQFDNYRVGHSTVSGTIARSLHETRVTLSIAGTPLTVDVSPAFAPGTELEHVELNGTQATPRLSATSSDMHISLHASSGSSVEARFLVDEPPDPAPAFVNPQPGDPAKK